jgi:hypothetical protein
MQLLKIPSGRDACAAWYLPASTAELTGPSGSVRPSLLRSTRSAEIQHFWDRNRRSMTAPVLGQLTN